MSTYSQTNIKCNDIQIVVTELKKYLPIGREIWFDTRKPWFYNVPHEENSFDGDNLTIVVSKNLSKDWVEIEFDFQFGLYFFDEILKQISKNLNTEILLTYYQSTSDEGRLAKFKNGQLELSYIEEYRDEVVIENNLRTIKSNYVADNFGVSGSSIELLKNSKLGEEFLLIDYDLINEFYRSEGWEADSGKNIFSEWDYLHLEQLK
ncbi:hypothetical protein [Flavobacterium sp. N2038]|uniref:hypothetical protein n=1 Tax=Flavobacterium sp. N2038 TaxID=2986829 RepID=UPI002224D67F|nr:hypothetical protein [Flavobacterium sp. N2038]